jgi:hypothetical protein
MLILGAILLTFCEITENEEAKTDDQADNYFLFTDFAGCNNIFIILRTVTDS